MAVPTNTFTMATSKIISRAICACGDKLVRAIKMKVGGFTTTHPESTTNTVAISHLGLPFHSSNRYAQEQHHGDAANDSDIIDFIHHDGRMFLKAAKKDP